MQSRPRPARDKKMAFVTTETRVAQATPVLALTGIQQAEIVTGKDGICEVDRLGEKNLTEVRL